MVTFRCAILRGVWSTGQCQVADAQVKRWPSRLAWGPPQSTLRYPSDSSTTCTWWRNYVERNYVERTYRNAPTGTQLREMAGRQSPGDPRRSPRRLFTQRVYPAPPQAQPLKWCNCGDLWWPLV